jgi:hypothetical protein
MDEINLDRLKKKELWEMTKAEYESVFGKPKARSSVTGKFSAHISAIEVALNRGLKVPDGVLADYPWLKEN